MPPKTMFEKIWDAHVVHQEPGQDAIVYVELHLVHEVTSAQAFDGLRAAGRKVRRTDLTVATADHNVPTENQHLPINNELSRLQVQKLQDNCEKFGVSLYGLGHAYQGIVHVIGPELFPGRCRPLLNNPYSPFRQGCPGIQDQANKR